MPSVHTLSAIARRRARPASGLSAETSNEPLEKWSKRTGLVTTRGNVIEAGNSYAASLVLKIIIVTTSQYITVLWCSRSCTFDCQSPIGNIRRLVEGTSHCNEMQRWNASAPVEYILLDVIQRHSRSTSQKPWTKENGVLVMTGFSTEQGFLRGL